MAQTVRKTTFKNAEISVDDMTITEVSKDTIETFNIFDVLKAWEGLPGVQITFQYSETIESCEDAVMDDTSDEME